MVESPVSSIKSVKLIYSGQRKKKRDSVTVGESAEDKHSRNREETPNVAKKPRAKTKIEKQASKKAVQPLALSPSKRSRFAPVDEAEVESKPTVKTSKKNRPRTVSESSTDDNEPIASPSTQSSPTVNTKKADWKTPTKASPGAAEDSKAVLDNSAPTPRPHRSESQRIQFLKDHPDCGEFEPRRAFCTRCERWVALSGSQSYPLTRWNKHIEKCGESPIKLDAPLAKEEESDDAEDGSEDEKISVAPSASGQAIKRSRNENERLEYLKADSRILDIKDHEVQCKTCQRWIKLGNDRKYMLTRWEHHKDRCIGALPGGRVATANRRLQLVNDSQARNHTPKSVECVICNATIVLEGEGDYDLAKWHDHKAQCPKVIAQPKSTQSSPARQAHPPASVTSTDTTAVASESSPRASRRGKRQLDVDGDGEDNVRRVRARTETYDPPPGNVPGIWEWVTYPFKAFMRGFKEGLGTGSPSGA